MTERMLLLSTGAAVTALGAGVVAVASGQPAWGVLGGAAGVVAGAAAAALAARVQRAEHGREIAERDISRLNRELDALSATLDEEVRRSRTPSTPKEKAEHAFDAATGLFDERYFAVLVQQQVAAARRSLRPISVVIFEIDSLPDVDNDASRAQALTVVGDVIRRTLRESDSACRLGELMIGAILEDTAEQGAVWAAERVRGTLLASPIGDALTISAGIACYPTHALGAAELVQQAGRALEEARRHGADRVEVAPEV
jgi:two-component system cell cycle response regulator